MAEQIPLFEPDNLGAGYRWINPTPDLVAWRREMQAKLWIRDIQSKIDAAGKIVPREFERNVKIVPRPGGNALR